MSGLSPREIAERIAAGQDVFYDDLARAYLAALARITDLEEALRKIVACDYRGNMPPEQAIARDALGRQA